MPYYTTATELQRNYRKVSRKAKDICEPMAVLLNNKPDLVVMDYDLYNLWNSQFLVPGKTMTGMKSVFGAWTKEEARKFRRTVNIMCEKIDPEMWK